MPPQKELEWPKGLDEAAARDMAWRPLKPPIAKHSATLKRSAISKQAETAAERLDEYATRSLPVKVRVVLQKAAAQCGLNVVCLLRHSRRKHIVSARRWAMHALLDLGFSQAEIGKIFRINHTTVMYHARRPVDQRLKKFAAIQRSTEEFPCDEWV